MSTKNTKFTLSQLVSKPARITPLVHPHIGEVGGWIDVLSNTNNDVYFKKLEIQMRLQANEQPSLQDMHHLNAELAAHMIADWDESFFEGEFTPEKAKELFDNHEYTWLRDAVMLKHSESEAFFTKG